MKREYIKPFCETVLVQAQSMLAGSGKISDVGNAENISSDFSTDVVKTYNESSGGIVNKNGGNSLSKSNQAWEEVGGYW
jgi:hypothetical protein